MKKVFILFALVGFFAACNNSTQTSGHDTTMCDSSVCDTCSVDSSSNHSVDSTSH